MHDAFWGVITLALLGVLISVLIAAVSDDVQAALRGSTRASGKGDRGLRA